ncbi:hypothetical protein [Arthrobacter sp.]|uniref:hypothetical protein n=1 Tax=Arthrobacter sp. TaxID=1667 RepID=UPI003A9066FD
MSAATKCPSTEEVGAVISERAYPAFTAGWCAGMNRRTTQPASQDVIEEIAAMLDAASIADALTQPE